MNANTLFQVIVSLVSFGLGNYLLFGVYALLSGTAAGLYPEATAIFEEARITMPLDIIAGFLLIGWPFYHAWSLKKN